MKTKDMQELIDTRSYKVYEILKLYDDETTHQMIRLINKNFNTLEEKRTFLEQIDKFEEFTSRDWFHFGVIFSKQVG